MVGKFLAVVFGACSELLQSRIKSLEKRHRNPASHESQLTIIITLTFNIDIKMASNNRFFSTEISGNRQINREFIPKQRTSMIAEVRTVYHPGPPNA
jgi:hypothetical protein